MSSKYGENSPLGANSKEYGNNYTNIDWSKKEMKVFKITEWSYEAPTQPGDYLCCRGDVETQANVTFERFSMLDGDVRDIDYKLVIEYVPSIKYARLIYTSDELKGVE